MTPEEHLARTAATNLLRTIRSSFERGKKSVLLDAVYWCLLYRLPLPEWANEAFRAAWDRARNGEIDSWDEVFGKPWGDGRRKTRWMEWRGAEIWFDVTALRKRGMKIEDAFAKVAAKTHMTVPTVRRFYYSTDRSLKKTDSYKELSQIPDDFEKP
jgi:hypothetical protein